MKRLLPLILVIAFIFTGCGKATKADVEADITKGDYKSAVSSFKELKPEEKTQITEKFKAEVEAIKTKFIKEEIDEVKATEALTEIKLVEGMETLAEEGLKAVKDISVSKTAFKAGKTAEDAKDNIKAVDEYSKVIKDDTKNYDVAQAKIGQLAEALKKDQKLEIKSIEIVPDYFEINDNVSVVVENKSDKVVKEYAVGIALYDANGYPLKSGILAGEQYIFGGKAGDANIQPGKTYGSDKAWNLYTDYGTIKKAVACVRTVTYYDGTQWENPYYEIWYNKTLGKPLQ
jgi:hypothetical protein